MADISLFAAALRSFLPESAVFLRAEKLERARGHTMGKKTKVILKSIAQMLRRHWFLCIHVLMTGT